MPTARTDVQRPDHCADLNPLLRARVLRDDPPAPLPVYARRGSRGTHPAAAHAAARAGRDGKIAVATADLVRDLP